MRKLGSRGRVCGGDILTETFVRLAAAARQLDSRGRVLVPFVRVVVTTWEGPVIGLVVPFILRARVRVVAYARVAVREYLPGTLAREGGARDKAADLTRLDGVNGIAIWCPHLNVTLSERRGVLRTVPLRLGVGGGSVGGCVCWKRQTMQARTLIHVRSTSPCSISRNALKYGFRAQSAREFVTEFSQ